MKESQKWYRRYLSSEHWKNRRAKFISQHHNQKCSSCDLPRWVSKIAYGQDLNVHHETYKNIGSEHDEDLTPLCKRCHEIETFGSSHLPSFPSKECDLCFSKTFSVYSEHCDFCDSLLRSDGIPRSVLLFRNYQTIPFWQVVLCQIIRLIGIDRIGRSVQYASKMPIPEKISDEALMSEEERCLPN